MRIFTKDGRLDHAKQYRNEWKYVCDSQLLAVTEDRLKAVLRRDSHNENDDWGYEIHSLYFDDLTNSCAKENDYGHPHRETIQTLKELGIDWLCTYDNTVIITPPGAAA